MDNSTSYYKHYTRSKVQDKDYLKRQELSQLYKRPRKETKQETPNFDFVPRPNLLHQADILYMPNDKGYKYVLVVVDVATREVEAQPLKDKSKDTILKALKTIYTQSQSLREPETLAVDSGTEFKGLSNYLNLNLKVSLPNRHRQTAVVERTNQEIAKIAFMRMTAQELLTNQQSNEWLDDLPNIIKEINKRKREPKPQSIDANPIIPKNSHIFNLGDKVRVKLDYPRDNINEKRLHGSFRITDVRWSDVQEITDIIMLPDQPIMYEVNNNTKVLYTDPQLQLVKQVEPPIGRVVVRGNPTTYIVEKIIGKMTQRGHIYYLVHWRGYDDPEDFTWELMDKLPKDKIKDYEVGKKSKF